MILSSMIVRIQNALTVKVATLFLNISQSTMEFSFVKNVLDRSISYILPFFEIRKREMHHKSRYENHLAFTSIFYGDDITEAERETAGKLAKANALNYNGTAKSVIFVSGIEQLKGVVQ